MLYNIPIDKNLKGIGYAVMRIGYRVNNYHKKRVESFYYLCYHFRGVTAIVKLQINFHFDKNTTRLRLNHCATRHQCWQSDNYQYRKKII